MHWEKLQEIWELIHRTFLWIIPAFWVCLKSCRSRFPLNCFTWWSMERKLPKYLYSKGVWAISGMKNFYWNCLFASKPMTRPDNIEAYWAWDDTFSVWTARLWKPPTSALLPVFCSLGFQRFFWLDFSSLQLREKSQVSSLLLAREKLDLGDKALIGWPPWKSTSR